jgi:hypothetical protein
MGMTKKVMVLFDPEQYQKLAERARFKGVSVGSLIRQAAEKSLAEDENGAREIRIQAARRLTEAEETVTEWDEIERMLERGHQG